MDGTEGSASQLPRVSRGRYGVIIGSSLIIMLCAGSVYAWSIFVAPLKEVYQLTTSETQLVYGLSLAILGVGLVVMHRVFRKLGPRYTAAIGAFFFSAGYLVASFSNGNFLPILLGISVLGGIGMSMGYITVLTNLVMWLPRNRGLATGIAVAGFGGGSVLMTLISMPLIDRGVDVLLIFRIVGIIYGILFLCGALALRAPSDAYKSTTNPENQVSYRELFRDKRFWVLSYTAFAAAFGGLMFYGNARPLGISYGVSEGAAVLAVILMSAGNALGRLSWGQIHDVIGGRAAIILSLILVTVVIPLVLLVVNNDIAFVIMVLIFGFCFGADQVLYASSVATEWGIHRMGIVYPLVFLSYGVAALIAPTLGGEIFDLTGSYTWAMIISSVVCLTGLPVYALMMPYQKREAHHLPKSEFGD
ncbi:MAG TPA: MFS transporter [Dehalococcoidales bacterium]|nr:MFS transporter [Dehalococcoidales bacterium]